ncbi:hypothetical protein ACQKFK_15105 [Bacillus mycoides]|uniref:hypothetical protein n=1 Tax=Bacillus TaxID=1386 RepID=UPI002E22C0F9|nr:hypothetical protein [Bacillus mycoides]
MEEKDLKAKKSDSIYLRAVVCSHKIDLNKIETLDDVIKILGLMDIRLDDKAVKGLEHLIEKEEEAEVDDYKVTAGVIKGEQL